MTTPIQTIEDVVREFVDDMENRMYLNDNNWTHHEIKSASESLRTQITTLLASIQERIETEKVSRTNNKSWNVNERECYNAAKDEDIAIIEQIKKSV